MAFKTIGQRTGAISLKDTTEPLIGTYVGHKIVDTDNGETTIWEFKDNNGNQFSVWNFVNLSNCMKQVSVGSLVRLTYKGRVKNYHQVLVEVDEKSLKDSEPE